MLTIRHKVKTIGVIKPINVRAEIAAPFGLAMTRLGDVHAEIAWRLTSPELHVIFSLIKDKGE